MMPAAIIGLFFEEQLEQLFGGNILLVGCMLIDYCDSFIFSG